MSTQTCREWMGQGDALARCTHRRKRTRRGGLGDSTREIIRGACPRGRGQRAWPCCGTPQPPTGGSPSSARWPVTRRHVLLPCFGRIERSLAVSPRPSHPCAPRGGGSQSIRAPAPPCGRAQGAMRAFCMNRPASHLRGAGKGRRPKEHSGAARRFVSGHAAHSGAAIGASAALSVPARDGPAGKKAGKTPPNPWAAPRKKNTNQKPNRSRPARQPPAPAPPREWRALCP
jgi:hypothetical protein